MECRDALKRFRREAGLVQSDVAAALHINIITVGRWEQGNTVPNRSFGLALPAYANTKSAAKGCAQAACSLSERG